LNGAWDGVLMIPAGAKSAHAPFRGNISNVVLKNIKVVDGLFPYSIFYGYDKDHTIKNVSIENFNVHGKTITNIKNAKFYVEETGNILFK
jgi:hypothetical protein